MPRPAGSVIGDWRLHFSPVTNHQSLITYQYPFGRASVSMKLPLRGESFHTWKPVSK
jgi:hypothetical protein